MRETKFLIQCRTLLTNDVYYNNETMLKKIDPWLRDEVVIALAHGVKIDQVEKVAQAIFDTSRACVLSSDDVLRLLPTFSRLEKIIENGKRN